MHFSLFDFSFSIIKMGHKHSKHEPQLPKQTYGPRDKKVRDSKGSSQLTQVVDEKVKIQK